MLNYAPTTRFAVDSLMGILGISKIVLIHVGYKQKNYGQTSAETGNLPRKQRRHKAPGSRYRLGSARRMLHGIANEKPLVGCKEHRS